MLSGVVLAGGRGSRIGGDKGLVDVAGEPMLTFVLRALSDLVDDVVVAVGEGTGAAYARALGPTVRIVEDRAPDRGPLEGLVNALDALEGEYAAVAPCDVPFLQPEALRLLWSRAVGREAAVPVVNGFPEPLVAVYDRQAGLKCFGRELEEGVGKVGNAIERMDVRWVAEEELRTVDEHLLSFLNVNTKDDLARADVMARRGFTRSSLVPSTV